ncbi:hypothetical protein ABXN37_09125 [Piscinibacter sakaiensis]|uniref:hypothetical protein n=1 Tax=Piscinibacter sakaiensis TaxID=1547922 RepID=UPI003726DE29
MIPPRALVASSLAVCLALGGWAAPARAGGLIPTALTDAEVARLVRELATAPAGGLWFVPFLVVAAVVGALIGSRASNAKASSDLFGRSGALSPAGPRPRSGRAGTGRLVPAPRPAQPSPSRRTAFSFRISGFTLSLKPASSKSFIQRSGVMSG